MLRTITIALASVLGIVALSDHSIAQEDTTCETRCERDYSACGDDPNDPCNKAKKSCLETCQRHASGQTEPPAQENTEPRQ